MARVYAFGQDIFLGTNSTSRHPRFAMQSSRYMHMGNLEEQREALAKQIQEALAKQIQL